MPTQEELENMSPEEIAELQRQNCPFCKIIAGEIPSQKVYEDEHILAILDINPSRKGHVLVLPKEHQPILPLIPPETFKQMFRMTKLISEGMKKATLTDRVSMFIANGAVAGQQSPHFLFHLMPREKGDGLDHLDLEGDESLLSQQKEIHSSLKHNMTRMMQGHLQREGQSPGESSGSQQQQPSQEQLDDKRQKIGKIIEDNPQVREMLMNDLDQFKELIEKNDELKNLFYGVDLKALSDNLKQMVGQGAFSQGSGTDEQQGMASDEQETKNSTANQQPTDRRPQTPVQQAPEPSTQVPEQQSPAPSTAEHRRPEVFLGDNPYGQRDRVMKYFEEKPKAKELLKHDPGTFKELLSKRDDIKPLFEKVDVEKLSEKLRQLEGGDS
ncbi:MAG: HIT domain-containing protein [Candidatus Woesearchaeota archaeon]